MRTWVRRPWERTHLYSPVALRLVDLMTDSPPLGSVTATLEAKEGAAWRHVDRPATITPGGVVAYPGLGRCSSPAGRPPTRYRVRIAAGLYDPVYRAVRDGVEFDVHPYDDSNPPQVLVADATDTVLAPAPAYPFPAHVLVLRGVVVDAQGASVSDAVVTDGSADRALTQRDGSFALGLRTAARGTPVAVFAAHPRSGRSGTTAVTLPDDLGTSTTIQIA